jgi:signal transduction histidine kinase
MRIFFGLVLALLIVGTVALLEMSHRDRVNRAVRLMDDHVRLVFAGEEARPETDYVSFPYLRGAAYSRSFKKLQSDQVKVPSPLLTTKPPLVRLHFQVDAEGAFSSPQVPTGTSSEIAEAQQAVAPLKVSADRELLHEIERRIEPGVGATAALRPIWRDGELFFVRRMDGRLQGFWVDWPALRAELLGEIEGIFPDATLVPGDELLTLPVALEAARPWTAVHTALVVIWIVVISVWFPAWRKHVAYIDKQKQFAAHVTHELRGPLTTFRLYHELLDEGLADAAKQKEYFSTLRQESDRLSHMVENVIALSRLESGNRLRTERVSLAEIMRRVEPELLRCAPDLAIDADVEAEVEADADAVGQILANLVDNAVKYGAPPIELNARLAGDRLEIAVRDHGEGPDGDPFRPYERGRYEGTALRGLGLGLPLSRSLARVMGGDLTLESSTGFVLRLPASRSA